MIVPIGLVAIAAAIVIFLYWRLRVTEFFVPLNAENPDNLQTVININPVYGVDLPRAGIGHNGGPAIKNWG